MTKKLHFMVVALMSILALAACSVTEVDNSTNFEEEKIVSDDPKKVDSISMDKTWEEVYKAILCDIDSNLIDPYGWQLDSNGDVYLGIHDFNGDNVPELIIGDSVAIAVYTYEKGNAVKVADLYEPEEWGGINGLYYKDNHLILVNNGSGGSCYL